jgi:hypothetical protein
MQPEEVGVVVAGFAIAEAMEAMLSTASAIGRCMSRCVSFITVILGEPAGRAVK